MANANTQEQQIIDACLNSLRVLRGCTASFIPAGGQEPIAGHLLLEGPWGNSGYRVKVVPRLTPMAAELAVHQLKALAPAIEPPLLMADFVSTAIAAKLRESGVEFLDSAGNAHLSRAPLLVEISGRKRRTRPPRTSRAFQPAGLRLVHLLLKRPEALGWTYRELAAQAGIALGAVGPVLKELEERGFIVPGQEKKKLLVNRLDLLGRWEIGYAERLYPKLYIETCRPAADIGVTGLPDLIRQQQLQGQVLVGGELGAALVLEGFHPASAILHLYGEPLPIMLRLRLVPDPDGEIELLRGLGEPRDQDGAKEKLALADPLLLHAEVARQGGREELARQLFERYLARHMTPRSG
jgi:hypothetical protein